MLFRMGHFVRPINRGEKAWNLNHLVAQIIGDVLRAIHHAHTTPTNRAQAHQCVIGGEGDEASVR